MAARVSLTFAVVHIDRSLILSWSHLRSPFGVVCSLLRPLPLVPLQPSPPLALALPLPRLPRPPLGDPPADSFQKIWQRFAHLFWGSLPPVGAVRGHGTSSPRSPSARAALGARTRDCLRSQLAAEATEAALLARPSPMDVTQLCAKVVLDEAGRMRVQVFDGERRLEHAPRAYEVRL